MFKRSIWENNLKKSKIQDEIDNFLSDNANNWEKTLHKLDEQHGKYKFMQYNLEARKRKLKQQIPDLERSLQMIEILRKQTDNKETQFLLSNQIFCKTTIPPTKTVCLWLGANVMLEYPLDEAESLLKANMESAITNLKIVEHDKDFLRDQCTTTEVNMARVYNWGIIKQRQAANKSQATS